MLHIMASSRPGEYSCLHCLFAYSPTSRFLFGGTHSFRSYSHRIPPPLLSPRVSTLHVVKRTRRSLASARSLQPALLKRDIRVEHLRSCSAGPPQMNPSPEGQKRCSAATISTHRNSPQLEVAHHIRGKPATIRIRRYQVLQPQQ